MKVRVRITSFELRGPCMVWQILNTKCQMGMMAPQMVEREWDKLALEPDLFTEYKVEIGGVFKGENCQYYAWSMSSAM